MYAYTNFKTKKALKEAVKAGPVPCFQPGPFGPDCNDGTSCCEGPHFPEPHRWYATVEIKSNHIIRVVS